MLSISKEKTSNELPEHGFVFSKDVIDASPHNTRCAVCAVPHPHRAPMAFLHSLLARLSRVGVLVIDGWVMTGFS
jgi:hypothetical protein